MERENGEEDNGRQNWNLAKTAEGQGKMEKKKK